MGISPKVNVVAQVEFELAYFDVAVQHVSRNDKGTATSQRKRNKKKKVSF